MRSRSLRMLAGGGRENGHADARACPAFRGRLLADGHTASRRSERRRLQVITAPFLALVGCVAPSASAPPGAAEFNDHFVTTNEVVLHEDADDPIGEIGLLVEASGGDLVVSDAILPRVRRYGSDGRLLAAFGQHGAGPFEFRTIAGVAEDSEGRLLLVDPRLGRVTRLAGALEPDTLFTPWPLPRGRVLPMGGRFLAITASGERSATITLFTDEWQAVWSIPSPAPAEWWRYPYWHSVGTVRIAATPDVAAVAFSLLYPIYLYDAEGTLVDSLPAPPTFRTAPVVEAGAFSGPGAARRIRDWLASFDVISELTVLQDTLLVVTHGVLRPGKARPFEEEHRSIDVYHIPSRSRLAANVALPEGGRVLGGGQALYVLVRQPPEQWTIARATFSAPSATDRVTARR